MTAQFVLPTLLAIGLVSAMGLFDWRLRPRVALPVLSTAMFIAASGLMLVVSGAAAGFVLGPARSSVLLEWCRAIPLHHRVSPTVGIGSVGVLGFIGLRLMRIALARQRAIRSVGADVRFSIIDHSDPIAHAVPTRTGCVVVSTGLLTALNPAERRAVFAHEQAHLRLGHHRHILLAEMCVAVVPLLRPLASQIRHATERAADEAAAAQLDDRSVVAQAISRAVLKPGWAAIPELGGGSVPRRVEALLWPDRERLASPRTSTLAAGIAFAAGVAVAVQLHHFGELVDHLCNSTS